MLGQPPAKKRQRLSIGGEEGEEEEAVQLQEVPQEGIDLLEGIMEGLDHETAAAADRGIGWEDGLGQSPDELASQLPPITALAQNLANLRR